MPRLSLAQLTEAVNGSLHRGDPATRVDHYVVDGRLVSTGSAFFALRGERADGHAFLGQAASAGASVGIVEGLPADGEPAPAALIVVDDGRAALARAGAWIRRYMQKARWIALTGSSGKTTTKEMIGAGLAARRRVHRTPGNFNNEIGVPLTLLAMPDETEIAVLELAMRGPGQIAELTRMVDPDVGLVTNVRAVHLAYFDSLDGIAAAKGELYALLREDAVSVVNLDDPHTRLQATRHAGPRVTFGRQMGADLRLEQVEDGFLPGATLTLAHGDRHWRLGLRIGGVHAAVDAVSALATIVAAGEDPESAIPAIEQLEAGPGRGRAHQLADDRVLIDDSYNSSPAALASVLDTLRATPTRGRRVLVMGDMLELGQMELALHREAGRRAATVGVQMLVAVGPLAREAAESARRSGTQEIHCYPNADEAAGSIAEYLRPNDLILVKGSRGIQLDRVVRALTSTADEVA